VHHMHCASASKRVILACFCDSIAKAHLPRLWGRRGRGTSRCRSSIRQSLGLRSMSRIGCMDCRWGSVECARSSTHISRERLRLVMRARASKRCRGFSSSKFHLDCFPIVTRHSYVLRRGCPSGEKLLHLIIHASGMSMTSDRPELVTALATGRIITVLAIGRATVRVHPVVQVVSHH
jgi:hypothetical protein